MAKGNPKGNPQNLKPFEKGEDVRRHLAGRPKKLPQLETILAKVLGEEKNGMEGIEAVITALRNEAITGRGASKTKAAEILLDRAYGKAVERVDMNATHVIEVIRVRKYAEKDDHDDVDAVPVEKNGSSNKSIEKSTSAKRITKKK